MANERTKIRARIKCDCGHYRTSHYSYQFANKYGCHAVGKDGVSCGCKCLRSREEVERQFGMVWED